MRFFGVFRGFMGLRFICLSCVVPIAERGFGKMNAKCILEEKAENAVKVIKSVVFKPIEQERAERARAD